MEKVLSFVGYISKAGEGRVDNETVMRFVKLDI